MLIHWVSAGLLLGAFMTGVLVYFFPGTLPTEPVVFGHQWLSWGFVLDMGLHMPAQMVMGGVRAERDLYAESRLNARAEEHGFRFTPVYSESARESARKGYVHHALEEDFHSLAHARIYVAGPPPMVDAVKTTATRRGADPTRIRADAFHASEPEKKSLWARLTGWGDL